ncbi:MAG: hypothetical protein PUP93_23860 [Rhizonema sp. NSF051]|nr:hypothetical protein [Rhizonema sp. NSF051]
MSPASAIAKPMPEPARGRHVVIRCSSRADRCRLAGPLAAYQITKQNIITEAYLATCGRMQPYFTVGITGGLR